MRDFPYPVQENGFTEKRNNDSHRLGKEKGNNDFN
jgi:hypothetical protein